MYIQKIQIKINSKVDKDKLVDDFGMLMRYYCDSGQIQGEKESPFVKNNKITCFPFTIEKKALDSKYNNVHVNRQIQKIEELCNAKFKFKTVGKTHDSYKATSCACKRNDFYILITNFFAVEPPLICGTCNYYIPLYRLPPYEDNGYRPILKWQATYKSCDTLQMYCEVGEKWALNQMQKPNSALSKQGLAICDKLEKLTNVPTFYYLHNYHKEKTTPNCPKCGNNWVLAKKLPNFYDYKCDKCRLIATVSFNS